MANTYGEALIQGLLNLAKSANNAGTLANNMQPVSMGARAGAALAETQTGTNPASNMGQAALQLGPYQKGVQKALSKAGEAHATEALQSGVPPTHIESQAGLNQPQTGISSGDPTATSGGAAPSGPQSSQGQSPQNILSSLMGMIYNPGSSDPSTGKVQFPTLFGMQSPNLNSKILANLSGQQTVSGQQPIQPIEQKTLQATGYQAQTQALQTAIKNYDDEMERINQQIEAEKSFRNPAQGLLGMTGSRIANLNTNLMDLRMKRQTLQSRLDSFSQPNFPSGPQGKAKTSVNPSAPPEALAEARRRGLI